MSSILTPVPAPVPTTNNENSLGSKISVALIPIFVTLILAYFVLGYNTVSVSGAKELINNRLVPIEQLIQQGQQERIEIRQAIKEGNDLLRKIEKEQAVQGVQIDTIILNLPVRFPSTVKQK